MKVSLSQKVAVITGAASGIGLAIAQKMEEAGAKVSILDQSREMLQKASDDSGGTFDTHVCDVTNARQVESVFGAIRQTFGRIDILVNNAGIAHIGNAQTTSAEDFERIQKVNVFGVANCTRSGLQHMTQNSYGGCILNMASTVSTSAIADRFAYSASKGAVLAMTYSVAKDFIDHKIRCNAIQPGRVHTPFVDGFIAKNYQGKEEEMFRKLSEAQPIGRMGQPDEIAAAAVFLCSDEASFITGATFPVDGGTLTLR